MNCEKHKQLKFNQWHIISAIHGIAMLKVKLLTHSTIIKENSLAVLNK